jgi:hypothetical protein
MKVLLLASVCISLAFGGCVWTADSVPITPVPTALPYQVHIISKRLLDGTEQIATIIAPIAPTYAYSYEYYYLNLYDSVRYIIVNGDTAYRHPVSFFPAVYDSAASYHFDGTANIVTFVYDAKSITDTSHQNFTFGSITWPESASPILRDTDLIVNYRMPASNFAYLSGILEVTDSITNVVENIGNDVGRTYVSKEEMKRFKGGMLWVILHESAEESEGPNYPYYNYLDHYIYYDRMVAYALQ